MKKSKKGRERINLEDDWKLENPAGSGVTKRI